MVGVNLARVAHLAAGQRLYEELCAAKRGRVALGGRALMGLWNELSSAHQGAYAGATSLAQMGGDTAEACYSVFVLRLPSQAPVTAWAALPPIDQEA